MTEIAHAVFDRHEVRKSKAQKAAFRAFARALSEREGYTVHEEKGSFGSINLVIGDPTKARVTYTAHYDTCARLPFPNFITPTSIWVYVLYQILVMVILMIPPILLEVGAWHTLGRLGVSIMVTEIVSRAAFYASLVGELYWIMAGPANPHAANDNTSGVITILELMAAMPPERRGEVAFILFDLEEMGMFGSSGYAARHKGAMSDKPLINFDCVSDGDTMLFALRKGAAGLEAAVEEAFPAEGKFHVKVMTKGVFYPSDQAQFPMGIGVAALKKSRRGILYMDRIHTVRDVVFEEENIAFLVRGSVRLAESLSSSHHN